jgi:general secretion pathway protein H
MVPSVAVTIFLHLAMPPARRKDEAGYTLLELLVVVAIIAMLMAVAPTAYGLFVPNFQARQFANELANVARDMRRHAVEAKVVNTIHLPEDSSMLRLSRYYLDGSGVVQHDAAMLEAPVALTVTLAHPGGWQAAGNADVEFYPSGGSSGGVFTVARGEVRVLVEIDWITGAVAVQQ